MVVFFIDLMRNKIWHTTCLYGLKPNLIKEELIMKTIISTIILGLSILTSQASHLDSELSINTSGVSQMLINLDGNMYKTSGNTYVLRDVAPGKHRMTVTSLEQGYHGTVQKVIFRGQIDVPHASLVTARVSYNGLLNVQSQPKLAPCGHPLDRQGHCVHGCDRPRPNGHGYGQGHGRAHGKPNNAVLVHTGPVVNCAPPVPAYVGMHPQTFQEVMRAVDNQNFSNSKMAVAKQAISANGISSRQVADMMGLFSFESYKLELAKFAYGYVADPQNYWMVNNSFSFSSSVRELDNFIAGYY